MANNTNSIQRYTTDVSLFFEFICFSDKYWLNNTIIQKPPSGFLNPFITTFGKNNTLIYFACPIDKLLNDIHDLRSFCTLFHKLTHIIINTGEFMC